MKLRISILSALIAAGTLLAGCQKQRDLYTVVHPMLCIDGDWQPSLGIADMSQNATAMIYCHDGSVCKEYFLSNSVTTDITEGRYDVLIFNGLMYSPDNTHLDNIFFCGTDRAETFEACVAEAQPNRRLAKQPDEFLASTEMGILAPAFATHMASGHNEYCLKYRDGQNGYPLYADYIETHLLMTPRTVSYSTRVTVNLINPASALAANGALRGFAGSVFLASGMPSHTNVTYQLKLNNMTITHKGAAGASSDPQRGTIESPRFVTFGPPLDLPDRTYEFEIEVALRDGNYYRNKFDVTDQITSLIMQLKANREQSQPQVKITIPIVIDITLPQIDEDLSGSIGVGDWGPDEIITVPIK